jgi:hypothetical protein
MANHPNRSISSQLDRLKADRDEQDIALRDAIAQSSVLQSVVSELSATLEACLRSHAAGFFLSGETVEQAKRALHKARRAGRIIGYARTTPTIEEHNKC